MQSCPDMFNFYVVLAFHVMVTNSGRATTFRRTFKSLLLQTKSTKNEGHSENMGFTENPFEHFIKKKFLKNITLDLYETTQWNIRALKEELNLDFAIRKK